MMEFLSSVRGLTDFLRLSDSLANRSLCRSGISRVQLKPNWTVGKRLFARDKSQFDKVDDFT